MKHLLHELTLVSYDRNPPSEEVFGVSGPGVPLKFPLGVYFRSRIHEVEGAEMQLNGCPSLEGAPVAPIDLTNQIGIGEYRCSMDQEILLTDN
jgi:hypothetical protein